MKSFSPSTLTWVALLYGLAEAAAPTWPSAIDELEDVMFLNSGYRSRGFGEFVTPCSKGVAAGRNTAAEWLRLGFHDMSTTNVNFAPHGGIDSSLAYELNDGENIGAGFATAFQTYGGFLNSRLSTSDLVALGVYASVRSCGGPVVPIRGGRKDVFAAGPLGVPQPQNGLGTFSNQFARMGFTSTEMIQMVACGHTLGGVHADNFPQIVTYNTKPNDYDLMDETLEFDNAIATNYINGPQTDPMVVGPATNSGRNADFVIFRSDQNVTMRSFTNADTFNSVCTTILQKMIDTVDPSIVTLTDPVEAYDVKPAGIQLTLLAGGTQLKFAGDIRVKTTTRSASQIASVQLAYKDRTGATVATPIVAAVGGTASGFDDTFTFYAFSATLSATTSISSFNVIINLVGGTSETYDNNGSGYPVSDTVIVQTPQSCLSGGKLTITAAIRTTSTTAGNLTVTQRLPPTGGNPIPSPLPVLSSSSVIMTAGSTYGSYKLYTGSLTVGSNSGTKYGVESGSFGDTFKDASDLTATCQPFGTMPSSSSSTVSSTSTGSSSSRSSSISTTSTSSRSSTVSTTSSSVSPTATLSHKPTVGGYTFQGCYTEGNGVRALSGGAFYDYAGMTLEKCASNCAGFSYFGVEYGGYCGNFLGAGAVLTVQADCSFTCPGNSLEYCGAGNRLEMYKLTSLSSSTGVSSSSTSTSRSGTTGSSSSSTKVSTTASPTGPTSTPTLHIVPSAGLYNYHGCYTEGDGVRALGAASFPSDTNTVESCVAACSPYMYAGVEYGRECWCADSFGTGSELVADSECSMTCAGSPYEYCGAGNRLTVYIRNGTANGGGSSSSSELVSSSTSTKRSTSTSKSVSLSSSSKTTSSKGSTSTSKSVSLSSSSKTTSSKSSTSTSKSVSSSKSTSKSSTVSAKTTSTPKTSSTSTSKSVASASKTSTFSKSTSTSSKKSSSSSSSKPPSTSPTTLTTKTITSTSVTCTTGKPTSTSSNPTSTQTAPAVKPTVGAYKYYGCQTEGTNVRALSSKATYDYDGMTLEKCAAACVGYKYWGVEYGGECYCGDSWGDGSVDADENDCNFACPGDKLEFCGAGNRLSSYEKI